MSKIKTTDITVLSYRSRDISLSDLVVMVGVDKDIHILLDCNDFTGQNKSTEVSNNYIKLVEKVVRTYINLDTTVITNATKSNRITSDYIKGIVASINSSLEASSRKHRYLEIQFKQTQTSDETYDTTKHLKVSFRQCAKKTTTIQN